MTPLNKSLRIVFGVFAAGAIAGVLGGCEGGDHAARTRGGMCLQHDQHNANAVDELFRRFEKATGSRVALSGRYDDFSVAVLEWGDKPDGAGELAALRSAAVHILENEEWEKAQNRQLKGCEYQQTHIHMGLFLDLLEVYRSQKAPAP